MSVSPRLAALAPAIATVLAAAAALAGVAGCAGARPAAAPAYPPYVLALAHGSARLLDSADGDLVAAVPAAGVTAIAAEPGGRFLLATRGTTGCSGELLDLEPGRRPALARRAQTAGVVDALAVAPDGSVAESVSTRSDCSEDELVVTRHGDRRVYVGADRQPPGQQPPANEFVISLAWSPDSRRLLLSTGVCCGYGESPRLLDLAGTTYPVDTDQVAFDSACAAGSPGAFDAGGRVIGLVTCDGGDVELAAAPGGAVVNLPRGTQGAVVADETGRHVLIGGQRLDGDRLVRLAPDGTQLVW